MLQPPCLLLFSCLWLIMYALCGDEDTRMKHWCKLKQLDGIMYQVAGIAMMVIFFGLPGARFALAFAAWGTFDSCTEALILGGEGDTADEAREHEHSMTISGPAWSVLGAVTAAA